ncbi:MAG: leucine-rich repeat domain-containing protein [Holosporales bacterium]
MSTYLLRLVLGTVLFGHLQTMASDLKYEEESGTYSHEMDAKKDLSDDPKELFAQFADPMDLEKKNQLNAKDPSEPLKAEDLPMLEFDHCRHEDLKRCMHAAKNHDLPVSVNLKLADKSLWQDAAEHLPQVRSLRLTHGEFDADAGFFEQIAQKATQIERLEILSPLSFDFQRVGDLGACAHLTAFMVESQLFKDEHLQDLVQQQPQLTDVHLETCQALTDTGLSDLQNLVSLTALNLGSTNITKSALDVIASKCVALESLQLNLCTQLNGDDFKSVAQFAALTSLNLNSTTVSDSALIDIANGCPQLSELNLAGCSSLTDAGFQALGQLSQLKKLILGGTRIGDAGMTAIIQNCTALIDLNIMFCYLPSQAVLKNLGQLTMLKVLNIEDTQLNSSDRKDLAGKLPNCVIFRL